MSQGCICHIKAHVAPSYALVPPSENSNGIMATSDKSQFKVLSDSGILPSTVFVCAFLDVCVCTHVCLCLQLQQEHLVYLGPSLLIHIQSLCEVLLDFSHTNTISRTHIHSKMHVHWGSVYLFKSQTLLFTRPTFLGSLNPSWLSNFWAAKLQFIWTLIDDQNVSQMELLGQKSKYFDNKEFSLWAGGGHSVSVFIGEHFYIHIKKVG